MTKSELTKPMMRAIIRFHGSPKSASEAKADKRTVDALVDKGLVEWSSGSAHRKVFRLTPAGTELYNEIDFEEAGL